MIKIYESLKDQNIDIEFIAIGTNLENKKWKDFIKAKNLNWINVSDFPEANENAKEYIYQKRVTTLGSLNFRLTYDIFSTPQVYLIDKEKTIIGKKLNALSLGRMMEHLEDIKIEYLDKIEKESKEEKERIEKSKKKNNTE